MLLNYRNHQYSENGPRQYAVVIYLPPPLEKVVAPLRERFDPDYSLVAAHLTLLFPLETDRALDELTTVVRDVVSQMKPLTISLDSVGDFYPTVPVIYWSVKDEGCLLDRLYKELYSRLEVALPFKKLIPHVTIAREISDHRVVFVKDQIAAYLPKESFEVKALDLISPVAGQQWVSVRTFPAPTA